MEISNVRFKVDGISMEDRKSVVHRLQVYFSQVHPNIKLHGLFWERSLIISILTENENAKNIVLARYLQTNLRDVKEILGIYDPIKLFKLDIAQDAERNQAYINLCYFIEYGLKFVSERMNQKNVTDIPGIGPKTGHKLMQKGITKAEQLYSTLRQTGGIKECFFYYMEDFRDVDLEFEFVYLALHMWYLCNQ